MTRLQQFMVVMGSFSLGLLLPVLNLTLMDKGAELQTLPLLLAVYSLTTLCFELPSGMCADIYGRKTVYLISCGFTLISFTLLLITSGIPSLICVMFFSGLSRAFSSGSLDALFLDDALNRHGEGCLAKVTSRMALLDGVGLACGSIAGGLLAGGSGSFIFNIVLRLIFTLALFMLCAVFIHELKPMGDGKKRIALSELIREGKNTLSSKPGLGVIFGGLFFIGFILSAVETFWQPAYMEIPSDESSTWMLGIITFLGFGAVALGNIAAQKLLDRHSRWWIIYTASRMVLASGIFLFAFQRGRFGFVWCYAFLYFALGVGNVVENTLINKMVPQSMRASILSLSSLLAQIGALSASLFSSLLINQLRFSGIWLISGALLAVFSIVVCILSLNKNAPGNHLE